METKSFKLRETNIPQQFKLLVEQELVLKNQNGQVTTFTLNEISDPNDQSNDCTDIFGSIFLALASIFGNNFFKDKVSSAITFEDTKGIGEAMFTMRSDFQTDDLPERETSGFYNYTGTFGENKEGIEPEKVLAFDKMEKVTPWINNFNRSMLYLHKKRIGDISTANGMTLIALRVIRNWMEETIQTNPDNQIELIIDDMMGHVSHISKEEYEQKLVPFAYVDGKIIDGEINIVATFGEELKNVAKGNSDFFTE